MIQQQINLLELLHGNQKGGYNFSIKKFIAVNVVFNLIMIVILTYTIFEWQQLHHKKALLAIEVANKEKTLTSLKNKFPKQFFDKQENASQQIRQEIASSKKILDAFGTELSFSSVLESLSKNVVPQVWLTHIQMINHNNDIILQGKSYSEKQLEQFINNLSKDNSLAAYALTVSKVERTRIKDQQILLDFEIRLNERIA